MRMLCTYTQTRSKVLAAAHALEVMPSGCCPRRGHGHRDRVHRSGVGNFVVSRTLDLHILSAIEFVPFASLFPLRCPEIRRAVWTAEVPRAFCAMLACRSARAGLAYLKGRLCRYTR